MGAAQLAEIVELSDYRQPLFEVVEPDQPISIDVAAMPEDDWSLRRAAQLRKSVGTAALSSEVQDESGVVHSLYDAIRHKERPVIRANVMATATEMVFKAGTATQIDLDSDERGWIHQNGHYMHDVARNALTHNSHHPVIVPRSNAETNNTYRIEDANRRDLLDDNCFVTITMTPENVDKDTLDKLDFFANTMSLGVQVTTKVEGKLILQTVFLAGTSDGGQTRYDRPAVEALYKELFNIDVSGLSADQILDRPQIVPKELIPKFAFSIAQRLDNYMPGNKFLGIDQEGDYDTFLEVCQKRDAKFWPTVDAITQQLIDETDQLGVVSATERMHKLVEASMVEASIKDSQINPAVFRDPVAIKAIVQARHAYWAGDERAYRDSLTTAVTHARGGSCPGAKKDDGNGSETTKTNEFGEIEITMTTDDCPEIKDGQLVTCPGCKKNVHAIVPNRETIFCSNASCELAAPWLLRVKAKAKQIGRIITKQRTFFKRTDETKALT